MTISDFLSKLGINVSDNIEPSSSNEPKKADVSEPKKPDTTAEPTTPPTQSSPNEPDKLEPKADSDKEIEALVSEIRELKKVNQSLLARTPVGKEKSISEDILNIAGFEIINEKE